MAFKGVTSSQTPNFPVLKFAGLGSMQRSRVYFIKGWNDEKDCDN